MNCNGATTEERIFPDPTRILEGCEFSHHCLEDHRGDDFFVALFLIMNSRKDYMEGLKNYHDELSGIHGPLLQWEGVQRLEDYTRIPTPLEIRKIVANCVRRGHPSIASRVAGEMTRLRKNNEKSFQGPAYEALGSIKKKEELGSLVRGPTRDVADIIGLSACDYGPWFAFGWSPAVEDVALKQFGIDLLYVRRSEKRRDWPYMESEWFREISKEKLLPIATGVLCLSAKDGLLEIDILRLRSAKGKKGYEGFSLGTSDLVESFFLGALFKLR